jgi:uncharacterized membrane protein YkoI
MLRNLSLPALVGIVLILGGHDARADPNSWTPASEPTAYGKRRISLIQAIAVAKRKNEGRAIHADFQMLKGKGIFEIDILGNEGLRTVTVDANSDHIVDTSSVQTVAHMTDNQRDAISGTEGAKVNLVNAAALGDEIGDWSIDAGVDEVAGKQAFRVDVVKDGKIRTVMLDPASGKPLTSAGANS